MVSVNNKLCRIIPLNCSGSTRINLLLREMWLNMDSFLAKAQSSIKKRWSYTPRNRLHTKEWVRHSMHRCFKSWFFFRVHGKSTTSQKTKCGNVHQADFPVVMVGLSLNGNCMLHMNGFKIYIANHFPSLEYSRQGACGGVLYVAIIVQFENILMCKWDDDSFRGQS